MNVEIKGENQLAKIIQSVNQLSCFFNNCAMEVRCEFYTGDEKYWFSKAYICEVTKIPKEKSTFSVEKFVGTHEYEKTDDDVKCLIISGHSLQVFPKNLHKKFPNLRFLKMKDCSIEKISQEDFIGLSNLECLNLAYNRLTSLPDDLFAGMKNLRWISFYDNKIERMSSKLFEPIKGDLVFADFKHNSKISEKFVKDEPKRDLEKLMKLIDLNCLPPERSLNDSQESDEKEICTLSQHKNMLSEFASLKNSGQFSDFTINFRGKEFKIHKCILAARSSVFERMFAQNDAEASKKIKNISDAAFEYFLDYLYSAATGDPGFCDLACELFELAEIFDVQDLKDDLTRKTIENLNESNALEAFELGHQLPSEKLKREAFKVIRRIFPDLDDSFANKRDEVRRLMMAKSGIDGIMKK